MPLRLVDRFPPAVAADELVARLVPPPQFADVRLSTYCPDPHEPSQQAALSRITELAQALEQPQTRAGRWRRSRSPSLGWGVYLDGGFGVGKTHLLAGLWHAAPGPKVYATFVELTHLVGAIGFTPAIELLSRQRLLCVDEFELDDPGDTVLISTLLTRLSDAGVALAATSNTLPGAQGEGRFAAQDFQREIQGLAARFEVLRVDGEDYRHRPLAAAPEPLTPTELGRATDRTDASCDDFTALLEHLGRVHPSRYGDLLAGISVMGWRDVQPVADQAAALRLVVLIDRAYDESVALAASGSPLHALFAPELLEGGYRKKHLRALSRLGALAAQPR